MAIFWYFGGSNGGTFVALRPEAALPLFLALAPQTLCVIMTFALVLMKEYPMAAFLGLCAIVAALNQILLTLAKIRKEEVAKK